VELISKRSVIVTLARIFEAFMNAEQFDFPTDPRSLLWHLLKIPHYGFAIFSLWTYRIIAEYISRKADNQKNNPYGESESLFLNWRLVTFLILFVDLILAWFAFEFFLEFFRQKVG